MLCDNSVLVLVHWNIYYYCASVLWFLLVLMFSVYMWGYFRSAYIRRNNVSVTAGSMCYRLRSCSQSHIKTKIMVFYAEMRLRIAVLSINGHRKKIKSNKWFFLTKYLLSSFSKKCFINFCFWGSISLYSLLSLDYSVSCLFVFQQCFPWKSRGFRKTWEKELQVV